MSLFKQPKAVWAVAFAAVVSFMGLGLVDPILPAIAHDLKASQADVELLFTSYFAITGIAMLVTSAVASRIGAKKTLLAGLVLIITFSALAGASNSVGAIVGLRAGWGLGNALFIATALSVIIGSASGGVAGAVLFYEAALGLGISVGPLLGGALGGISWRGPFFGVAVLMLIGLVAIAVFLDRTPPPATRTSVLDPLRALRHRATRGSGLTAVFYNFGFFTILAYAPFPLHLGVHELGYTFCAWGIVLAVFSIFVAPPLARRFGDVTALAGNLAGMAALLVAMGLVHDTQAALIACVIVAGAFLGINNTLMTQVVMESAPVERSVASASYSFVRFTGGAIAPYVAGKLGEHVGVGIPFYLGAGMTALSIVILLAHRDALHPVEEATAPIHARPVVVAVEGPDAAAEAARAATEVRDRGGVAHVLHVVETDVLAGEAAADAETRAQAERELAGAVAALREAGIEAGGELLHAYGDHAAVAAALVRRAAELGAPAILVGSARRHGLLGGGSVATQVVAHAGPGIDVVTTGREGATEALAPAPGASSRH